MEYIKTFGEKLENVIYVTRTGVYAIILDQEAEKVAIIKTKTGYFLPGGGIEEHEEHEECLRREGLEEIGCAIKPLEFIGQAQKYGYVNSLDTYILSIGFFYLARLVGIPNDPSEDDHELMWIERAYAHSLLTHEHQAWAVKKALDPI